MNTDMQKPERSIEYFTVVGVGRSGTSLLMTMLDSHPELAMPPETQFVTRHVVARPKATREEARARLASETNFQRLALNHDEFFQPFDSGRTAFSNAEAYKRIIALWAEKTGQRRVGDKSPKNVECLPVIKRLFPHAKVVHIIRDPRDVFLSRTRAGWCAGRSPWLHTLAYRAQHDCGREQGRRLFGDNYLEVHYEELVGAPGTALNRICGLLGVEYDDRMLNRDESAGSHVFPEEMAWKREVLGPLLNSNTEKWRTDLPAPLVSFIEDCCITAFSESGYQPANNGTPGRGGIRGRSTRLAMQAMSRAYRSHLTGKNTRALAAIPRPKSVAA